MTKEKLIIANFKMNLNTENELNDWLSNFKRESKKLTLTEKDSHIKIILCVPIIHLKEFVKKIKHTNVFFGAQNCFWEQRGAFTGELSPLALKNFGGEFVILGHSERKAYLGETLAQVKDKYRAVLALDLRPILCIGENLQEKKDELTFSVISKQLDLLLNEVSPEDVLKTVFCYEPIWAISANNPDFLPTSDDVMSARLLIKKIIFDNYGKEISDAVTITYGGSVKADNFKSICLEAEMDGALIGGASLSPLELIKMANEAKQN